MALHPTTGGGDLTKARWFLSIAAHHEAGHAVMILALAAPLYDARVSVKPRFFGGFKIEGRVRTGPPGGDDLTGPPCVLTALAGSAAEARFLHLASGGPLTRLYADAAKANHRDMALATEALAASGKRWRNMRAAEQEAQRMIADRWSAVERLATALMCERPLTARAIRKAVA